MNVEAKYGNQYIDNGGDFNRHSNGAWKIATSGPKGLNNQSYSNM
jgi:hypothetical protein